MWEPKFCPECGADVVRRCPNGHEVDGDAAFCPQCGQAVEGAASSGAATPSLAEAPTGQALRFSGLPSATPPWLARVGGQSFRRAAIVTLLLSAVLSVVYLFVYTPRFVFWIAFGLVVFLGVASTKTLTARTVGGFYLVALAAFILDWVIERIDSSARDFSTPPISGARLLAYVGTASLALLVVAYFDPDRRRQLRAIAIPHATLDPLRAAGMVALAALALFPVVRSFTGGLEFGVIRSGGSLFSGYPSTDDVKNLVVREVHDLYGDEASTDLLECPYFLPAAGPPPLWNCSVKVVLPGAPVYYDNLQITGRKDGTFDCYDGSQTGMDLC